MSSIIPSKTYGGITIRDKDGNLITNDAVSNVYNPSKEYTITCDLNYLPSDCSARLTPEQINAFQSELISFSEGLVPNGEWNCGKLNNLQTAFTRWWDTNKPNLTEYLDKETYDPNNQSSDVFSMGNMFETKTAKILTAEEREAIIQNTNIIKLKSSDRINWIINGGFTINQRGVASPRNVAVGTYGCDRWAGHANGLYQAIEGLPAGKYTLTWTGGGVGYFGTINGLSPIVADAEGGNQIIIVPKNATNVSLVVGDASNLDPWQYVQRPIATELALCQRYYESGVTYQGGWIAQFLVGQTVPFKVTKRATPTIKITATSLINGSNPRALNTYTDQFTVGLDVVSGATATRTLFELSWIADAEF